VLRHADAVVGKLARILVISNGTGSLGVEVR